MLAHMRIHRPFDSTLLTFSLQQSLPRDSRFFSFIVAWQTQHTYSRCAANPFANKLQKETRKKKTQAHFS